MGFFLVLGYPFSVFLEHTSMRYQFLMLQTFTNCNEQFSRNHYNYRHTVSFGFCFRCQKIIIVISEKFLTSDVCDFQLQFAQALAPGK